MDRPKAHQLLRLVTTSPGYEVVAATPDLAREGLLLHEQRADKAWSWTDCISFVVMTTRGVRRALTHDRHFEQAGFEALLRRDP